MNDFNALLQTVIREAKAVGIPVSDKIDSRIRINSRAVTRFGRCSYTGGRYTIELAEVLLNAPELSCKQTIAHELIHTCPDCMNHGVKFRKYADMMNKTYGYHISRTNSEEEMGVESRANYQYRIVCESCGNEFMRTRRTSVIEHPERYHCQCGGKLKVFRAAGKTPDKPAADSSQPKYLLQCIKCGKKFGRERMSETIKNPSKYRCPCGGRLNRLR